ncbi:hypothetical protein GGF39_003415 [Coemansia sp. RSA 1721]|nr:hypothetical protein GGF39_003415 [Coemansia sp. RSA 1721]
MSPTTTIVSYTGTPYALNGFQSLSNKAPLTLRTAGFTTGKASLGTEYVVPQWNPIIDVLAVPEGKALRLVRLSGGQTIWRRTLSDSNTLQTASADKKDDQSRQDKKPGDSTNIRAISWHPSGSRIAVLHANGALVHRDLARGDIVHESSIEIDGNEMVVDMQWICCSDSRSTDVSNDSLKQQLEFYLPRLSPLDKSKSAPENINPADEPMTAIVVTSSNGSVWVSLGGIFTLPVAQLPQSMDPLDQKPKHRAVSAHLASSGSHIYIKLLTVSAKGTKTFVLKLNTPLFNTVLLPSPTLHNLATLSARLSGLNLYLENTLATIVKEIEARESSASRRSLYRMLVGVLQDHGVDEVTSPEAEIIRLAVTGRASESTAQFLLSKLKAVKLNNWESASRMGAVVVIRLIYQHALPAVERTILAAAQLLDFVLLDNTSLEPQHDSPAIASRDSIVRALVILVWLYSRVEECMIKIRDEQRENQEFADWALFSIDDLQWQSEGSRRIGNDGHEDADGDDGSRPVRPEINYRLLLSFIRSAFCCRQEEEFATDDTETNAVSELLKYNREQSDFAESRADFVQTYFNLLVEKSNPQGLDFRQIADSKGTKSLAAESPFDYVFHSEELLYSTSSRCGYADIAPTCQEAIAEAKTLLSQALDWPSQKLGQGLSWDADPAAEYSNAVNEDENEDGELSVISDTYQLPDSSDEVIYIATCMASAKNNGGYLELLCISNAGRQASEPSSVDICSIEMAVRTQESLDTKKHVNVSGIRFFDATSLGVLFTVDGCSSTFLGTIDYRNIGMEHLSSNQKVKCIQPLSFTRLLEIKDVSAKTVSALAVNGRKGRRCIAVVERRGRQWWPYDMDNTEEDDDDDNDEEV